MEKEFRVGHVFAGSLKILFANFVPFMAIAFIVTLPVHVVDTWDSYLLDTGQDPIPAAGLVTWILSIVLSPIVTGTITFGVIQQLRGRHASVGRCVSVGFSRLLPVLAVALLVGLVTGLGFVLLVIPGLWFACRLWVSIPVAVVERAGIMGALNRSDELTKGSRWRILGVLLLIVLVQIGFGIVIGIVIAVTDSLVVMSVAIAIIGTFGAAWTASAQAVSYYTLRSMKEMINVEEIASVFD